MKSAVAAVMMVFIIMVSTIGAMYITHGAEATPKASSEVVKCTDIKIGKQIHIRCTAAGVVVLDQTIDVPAVTVPPITINGPTVTIPGETRTIKVPGPTIVGPTSTVTQPGGNEVTTETVTITEPAETSTTTVTATPRQVDTTPGTIETPQPEDDVVVIPEINLNRPQAIGLGAVTVIVMMSLILLGMYGGYYLGFKDSDKAEAEFLKSLLKK